MLRKIRFVAILISCIILVIVIVLWASGVFSRTPVYGSTPPTITREYMWYYLPAGHGDQPLPMEKAKFFKKYDVYYVGRTDEKVIYLTFDDCPENNNIPAILDVLEKHHATAAFFMTGSFVDRHPDIVRRMVADGYLVCNHTTHHIRVTALLDFEKFKAELSGIENSYKSITGSEMPKYFRPPQGKFSELSLKYTEKMGYTTVFWSFRYVDWELNSQPTEQKAFSTIINETHHGAIVLLHCQSKTNVKILDKVLDEWEHQGYTFQSLDYLTGKDAVPVR